MEVEILSRKVVSPSSPTLHHLRRYQISALDQAEPHFVYASFIYTYESAHAKNITQRLQTSLSEILTLYYPLAGRFLDQEKDLVTCNDKGAEFVEAKVVNNVRMDQLRTDWGVKQLNLLLPQLPPADASRPLLLIQVTTFECGGVAIAVRFARRVADMLSMAMFVSGWAMASRLGLLTVVPPSLELPSIFPPRDAAHRIQCGYNFKNQLGGDFVQTKLVFNKDVIQSLRDEIGKAGIRNGNGTYGEKKVSSRVAVVTAVMWRSLIRAAGAKHGRLRPSSLFFPVDMRRLKTVLQIPQNSFGNFITCALARFVPEAGVLPEWQELVALFEEAKERAVARCVKQRSKEEMFLMVADSARERREELERDGVDAYGLSSWCGFPFKDTDFGWGKLAWLGLETITVPVNVLLDHVDGNGIEAWVSLQQDQMLLLQQDPYIVSVTS